MSIQDLISIRNREHARSRMTLLNSCPFHSSFSYQVESSSFLPGCLSSQTRSLHSSLEKRRGPKSSENFAKDRMTLPRSFSTSCPTTWPSCLAATKSAKLTKSASRSSRIYCSRKSSCPQTYLSSGTCSPATVSSGCSRPSH